MYPDQFNFHAEYFDKIMGTTKVRKNLDKGMEVKDIINSYSKELENFYEMRKPYLLYEEN